MWIFWYLCDSFARRQQQHFLWPQRSEHDVKAYLLLICARIFSPKYATIDVILVEIFKCLQSSVINISFLVFLMFLTAGNAAEKYSMCNFTAFCKDHFYAGEILQWRALSDFIWCRTRDKSIIHFINCELTSDFVSEGLRSHVCGRVLSLTLGMREHHGSHFERLIPS